MSDLTVRAARAECALRELVNELDTRAIDVRGLLAAKVALDLMPLLRQELEAREAGTEDAFGNQR